MDVCRVRLPAGAVVIFKGAVCGGGTLRAPGRPPCPSQSHWGWGQPQQDRNSLTVMSKKKTHTKKRRLTDTELLLLSFKALMKAHRTGDPELIERATRVHDLHMESIELKHEWLRQQLLDESGA